MAPLATLVDDITIVDDLRREHEEARVGSLDGPRPADAVPPDDQSYRVLSDDPRLLRLVARPHVPRHALRPRARRRGRALRQHGRDGRRRASPARRRGREHRPGLGTGGGTRAPVRDRHAAARRRPRGRPRAPAPAGPRARLHGARRGGRAPAPRRRAVPIGRRPSRNLVRLFGWWREPLRAVLATNPACTRLAPLPPRCSSSSAQRRPPALGDDRSTGRSCRRPRRAPGLTKYFDVNLTALLTDRARRATRSRCASCRAPSTPRTSRAARASSSDCSPAASSRQPVPRPTSTDPAGPQPSCTTSPTADSAGLVLSAETRPGVGVSVEAVQTNGTSTTGVLATDVPATARARAAAPGRRRPPVRSHPTRRAGAGRGRLLRRARRSRCGSSGIRRRFPGTSISASSR